MLLGALFDHVPAAPLVSTLLGHDAIDHTPAVASTAGPSRSHAGRTAFLADKSKTFILSPLHLDNQWGDEDDKAAKEEMEGRSAEQTYHDTMQSLKGEKTPGGTIIGNTESGDKCKCLQPNV